MTDRLSELLEHTADQWSLGAEPPPLPALLASAGGSRPARRASLKTWAPLAAAAAVVAVAVPAVMLDFGASSARAPVAQVGEPVAIPQDSQRSLKPTDAALPQAGPAGHIPPDLRACDPKDVSAVLDLTAGALRIDLRSGAVACALPADLRVAVPSARGVAVVHEQQPDVPNPPVFEGRFLHANGIAMNVRWSGDCGSVPREAAMGQVPVSVTGSPATCSTSPPVLTLGPAHAAGAPSALVPKDRARLQVSLEAPEQATNGGTISYQVLLTNPTENAVALSPCPTFVAMVMTTNAGGGGGPGRLPCEQLPDHLGGREQIRLLMTSPVMTAEPGANGGELQISWGIAGTDPAKATVSLVQHEPTVLPAVPYADTGGPGTPGTFRYQSAGGAFPIRIEGPATVRAGQVLRYRAVLTNPDGAAAIPLRPCPAWTETFVLAPAVAANPKPAVRTGAVNCAQAPETIEAGQQIAFEMELAVPAHTPAGPYQVFWQIHRGLDSEPFDVTVAE